MRFDRATSAFAYFFMVHHLVFPVFFPGLSCVFEGRGKVEKTWCYTQLREGWSCRDKTQSGHSP